MSNFHNPGLEGNPHFRDVTAQQEPTDQMVSATLAVAYEQRTASLIAVFNSYTTVQLHGVDYTALANQIVARLQPEVK